MIKSEQLIKITHWIEKFRKVIITMFVIVIITTSLVYFVSDYIIDILKEPLNGLQLFFMTPVEGFMARLKVSFLGGIILSSPFFIYIIISLVEKNMTKMKKILIYFTIIPLALLLFTGGIFFGYKMILPSTIKFLIECSRGFMTPVLSGSDYFSFISILLLTIGMIFELPLVLIALSSIGIVTSKMLMRKRKVAVMISLLTIALLSPALDAFTFILVTLPIIILYEGSIWCIYILEKRRKRKKLKNSVNW